MSLEELAFGIPGGDVVSMMSALEPWSRSTPAFQNPTTTTTLHFPKTTPYPLSDYAESANGHPSPASYSSSSPILGSDLALAPSDHEPASSIPHASDEHDMRDFTHACKSCSRKFVRRYDLVRHMRIHSGEVCNMTIETYQLSTYLSLLSNKRMKEPIQMLWWLSHFLPSLRCPPTTLGQVPHLRREAYYCSGRHR